MPTDTSLDYIRPEERIYQVATNKDEIDWKGFLYQLIHNEGLDPWNIDLSALTHKYLSALKEMQTVDFDISGKLLTIAVFLLKTKAEVLVERDIRGIGQKIADAQNPVIEDYAEELEGLEMFDEQIEQVAQKKKEKYSIKVRNPLARKRKVNIFDLIKSLEKTFQQSNRRRANFLMKNSDVEYDGPMYEKKPKDLKTIIEELHQIILDELSDKKGQVHFSHLTKGVNHKMGILEKFIPLLHLHNQSRLHVTQEKHFGDIRITKGEEK